MPQFKQLPYEEITPFKDLPSDVVRTQEYWDRYEVGLPANELAKHCSRWRVLSSMIHNNAEEVRALAIATGRARMGQRSGYLSAGLLREWMSRRGLRVSRNFNKYGGNAGPMNLGYERAMAVVPRATPALVQHPEPPQQPQAPQQPEQEPVGVREEPPTFTPELDTLAWCARNPRKQLDERFVGASHALVSNTLVNLFRKSAGTLKAEGWSIERVKMIPLYVPPSEEDLPRYEPLSRS